MTRRGHLLNLVDVTGIRGILRVIVFHDEDIPPVHGRDEGFDGLGGHLRQDRGISCAEVTAAALCTGHL